MTDSIKFTFYIKEVERAIFAFQIVLKTKFVVNRVWVISKEKTGPFYVPLYIYTGEREGKQKQTSESHEHGQVVRKAA